MLWEARLGTRDQNELILGWYDFRTEPLWPSVSSSTVYCVLGTALNHLMLISSGPNKFQQQVLSPDPLHR
jgi:hypothetical protein